MTVDYTKDLCENFVSISLMGERAELELENAIEEIIFSLREKLWLEIQDFYTDYFGEEVSSFSESRRYLNELEQKSFLKQVDLWKDENDIQDLRTFSKEFEKIRLTRAEKLLGRMRCLVEVYADGITKLLEQYVNELLLSEFYLSQYAFLISTGINFDWVSVTTGKVKEEARNRRGKFVPRSEITALKNRFFKELENYFPKAFAKSETLGEVCEKIKKMTDLSIKELKIKCRNETNRTLSRAVILFCEAIGITEFIYVSADNENTRTNRLNMHSFKLKGAKFGEILPPVVSQSRDFIIPGLTKEFLSGKVKKENLKKTDFTEFVSYVVPVEQYGIITPFLEFL